MNKFTQGFLFVLFIATGVFATAQNNVRDLPGPDKSLCFSKEYTGTLQHGHIRNINSVFEEDFSGTWPPDGWTVSGLGTTNWQQSTTNNAGGSSPEAMMGWSPQFNGLSRFVSPQINTTGYSTLALQFKHFVDDYSGSAYAVKVETTTDGTNWDEVYSVSPTGNVGPETVTSLVTNGVGSATFQIALTFSGNSYNVDYWYIDDLMLFEALSYDAEAAVIQIPAQIPTDFTLEPSGVVINNGMETASFEATLAFKQGATTVYTSTVNVTNVGAFQSQVVEFTDWPTILGDYTAYLTVALAGDQNPANDQITKDFQVLDGMVFKKQLIEEFTSSTCAPCAAANPIIDAVLAANPGEYSLIKYQMNWPGSGDIYYTEQGGDRRDYYGVSYVPDLYINSDQYDASSMSQAIFDQYVDDLTAMDIEAEAEIDESGIITVSATLQPYANYTAGLKAHIVVVEKTTVGNVGSNGETEFHNVMMIMLPGSSGTTLGAISQGVPVQLSESYDMTTTNMEEPTDLAVIVFVQDDTDKSIIQSQMVDVEASGFVTYSVTFNVHNSNGEPVEGAVVNLESQASQTTNSFGQVIFPEVFPGDYDWTVTKAGLEPASGNVTVTNADVVVPVFLMIPDFYYYEDFGTGLPDDWTTVFSGWNSVYWYNGMVIIFRQDASGELWLISPSIDLSQAQSLFIEVGNNSGNPSPTMIVGTVPDPTNTAAFTELGSVVPPTSGFEDFEFDLSGYTGTDTYIAITYDGPDFGYFYIETFKMTGGMTPPMNAWETFEDYNAGEQLALQANAMGRDYWTTWSNAPGSAEDPMVTNEQAHTGSNSMVIEGTNDCVLLFGDKTEGKYALNFYTYIPEGFFGYFNMLQVFAGASSEWGMQAYFDAGGVGTVDAGGAGAGAFTYLYNTWINVEVVVDLDEDFAEMFINGSSIITWQWSLGTFGTPGTPALAAANFYAWNANGTPKAFFDDINFDEVINALVFETFEDYTAGGYVAEQAIALGRDYWTTWSGLPGSAEDPLVSNEHAHGGSNALLCSGTNDGVMLFGDKTEGSYAVNFYIYVPAGKVGYYNILQSFTGGNYVWGSEVYFNPGGIAELNAGGVTGVATFNYNFDEWVYIENIFDLDNDAASLKVNGAEVYTWQWSIGASGTGINQLAAMDIYAATTNGTPYFFMDDIEYTYGPTVGIGEIEVKPQTTRIFPNPATDVLNISSENELTQVRIINHLGQTVFNSNITGNNFSLNTSGIQGGLYFVEITTFAGVTTQKLIIK